MVYSTCTFSLQENEMIMDRFLKTHHEFELVNIDKKYGFVQGFYEYVGNEELKKAVRLFPHKLKGEGHFICLLRKHEGEEARHRPQLSNVKKDDVKDYLIFSREYLHLVIDENLYLVGENLYSLPAGLCEVKGLRILRSGLHLGAMKKNRFEPNHALALAVRPEEAKNSVNLSAGEEDINFYLKGHTLNYPVDDGWCIVSVDGYSIGWGKASRGTIKNHYPKGLRW
jgi:NOL1/NOP2/fmu family ribosome biogenesis protein